MKKIRQKDEIIVLTGKDKGKRGTVMRVFPNDKVIVEGINIAKRHTKPNPNNGIPGGIVDKEMPIHISNVALFNSAAKKADRVGIRILDNGKKVRYFKSDNEVIDR